MSVGRRVARLDGHREAEDHRVRGFEIVRVAFDANERTDTRAKLVGIERFAEEVVGAGLDAANAIARIAQRGHEDHRNQPRRRVLLQLPTGLEPVEPRHHHIEQDQIGVVPLDLGERRLAVVGRGNHVPLRPEHRLREAHVSLDIIRRGRDRIGRVKAVLWMCYSANPKAPISPIYRTDVVDCVVSETPTRSRVRGHAELVECAAKLGGNGVRVAILNLPPLEHVHQRAVTEERNRWR